MEYAATAEKNVNHHLARAIEDRAKEENIEVNLNINQYTISDKKNSNLVKIGRGVTVTTQNGHGISVGNTKFMEEQIRVMDDDNKSSHLSSKFSLVSNVLCYRYLLNSHNQNPDSSTIGIQQVTQSKISNNFYYDLLSASTTTAFVSLDGKIIGCILLEDKLRKQAKEALSEIKSMGINLVMLTGDNENIAKRIAVEAGIDKFYANLLPQEKISKIEEIVDRQKRERKKKLYNGWRRDK